ARKANLHRVISMRNCIDFAKTISGGPNPDGWRTLDECVERLTQSWTPEEKQQVGLSSDQ
ncbi:MAG: hypothetical protein QF615_14285, partial [Planctomycetota bacterium]|nr:hypothetical protein [Planctomycetota bacterium]